MVVQEEKNTGLARQKKDTERELDNLKKSVQDLEVNMRKSQSETQAREHQIKSLQVILALLIINKIFFEPKSTNFRLKWLNKMS